MFQQDRAVVARLLAGGPRLRPSQGVASSAGSAGEGLPRRPRPLASCPLVSPREGEREGEGGGRRGRRAVAEGGEKGGREIYTLKIFIAHIICTNAFTPCDTFDVFYEPLGVTLFVFPR